MIFKNNVQWRARAAVLLMSILILALSPAVHSQGLSMTSATPTPGSNQENSLEKLAAPRRKPIPLAVKVVIVLGLIAAASGTLWVALRVWRSANLFDRQYHFPTPATAALRLGATRSGGHMATIGFADANDPLSGKNS